jgi:hypothetical protein
VTFDVPAPAAEFAPPEVGSERVLRSASELDVHAVAFDAPPTPGDFAPPDTFDAALAAASADVDPLGSVDLDSPGRAAEFAPPTVAADTDAAADAEPLSVPDYSALANVAAMHSLDFAAPVVASAPALESSGDDGAAHTVTEADDLTTLAEMPGAEDFPSQWVDASADGASPPIAEPVADFSLPFAASEFVAPDMAPPSFDVAASSGLLEPIDPLEEATFAEPPTAPAAVPAFADMAAFDAASDDDELPDLPELTPGAGSEATVFPMHEVAVSPIDDGSDDPADVEVPAAPFETTVASTPVVWSTRPRAKPGKKAFRPPRPARTEPRRASVEAASAQSAEPSNWEHQEAGEVQPAVARVAEAAIAGEVGVSLERPTEQPAEHAVEVAPAETLPVQPESGTPDELALPAEREPERLDPPERPASQHVLVAVPRTHAQRLQRLLRRVEARRLENAAMSVA